MSQTQPFPLADDFQQQDAPPSGDPSYLAQAPLWFTAWRREEFVPFRTSVTRKLAVKDLALALGKYVGAGIVGAVVAKFPALAEHAKPILDVVGTILGAQ